MEKQISLFGFIFLFACNQTPHSAQQPSSAASETKISMESQLTNTWRFVSIEDTGGNVVREVSETDSMIIRKDKSFQYDIAKSNVHAYGEWNFEENILSFTYHNLPQTDSNYSRQYFVQTLNDKNLILVEKGVNYKFRR